jgi:hypothetical protein
MSGHAEPAPLLFIVVHRFGHGCRKALTKLCPVAEKDEFSAANE